VLISVPTTKLKEVKRSTTTKSRILVEEGMEVIEVDAETETERCYENSNVEEAPGNGDKVVRVQQQSQSMLLFDLEMTNAKLKVASGEKVWGYETQRDLESVRPLVYVAAGCNEVSLWNVENVSCHRV